MDDLWGNAWGESSHKTSLDSRDNEVKSQEEAADEVDIGVPSWQTSEPSDAQWETPHEHSEAREDTTSSLPAWPADSTHSHRIVPSWSDDSSPWGPPSETLAAARTEERTPTPARSPSLEHVALPTPDEARFTSPFEEEGFKSESPVQPVEPPSPPGSPGRLEVEAAPVRAPPSPDAFGTFESGQLEYQEESSWSVPETHTVDSGWDTVWEAKQPKKPVEVAPRDEWAEAQELQLKRNQRVPQELIESLILQWNEVGNDIWPSDSATETNPRGISLDDMTQITTLMADFVPQLTLGPPINYLKTSTYKQQHLAMKLSKASHIAKSSPFSHIFTTKGNDAWEDSIKTHIEIDPEQFDTWALEAAKPAGDVSSSNAYPAPPTVEKKQAGWAFWGRKGSAPVSSRTSTPAPVSAPSSSPAAAVPSTKAASQSTSARQSGEKSSPRVSVDSIDAKIQEAIDKDRELLEALAGAGLADLQPGGEYKSLHANQDSEDIDLKAMMAANVGAILPPSAGSLAQPATSKPQDFFSDTLTGDMSESEKTPPSAVSRFLSRFSRQKSGESSRHSTNLSSTDLQFLSDVPTMSEGQGEDPLDSLEKMLSGSSTKHMSNTVVPTLLPPPSITSNVTRSSSHARSMTKSGNSLLSEDDFFDSLGSSPPSVGRSSEELARRTVPFLPQPYRPSSGPSSRTRTPVQEPAPSTSAFDSLSDLAHNMESAVPKGGISSLPPPMAPISGPPSRTQSPALNIPWTIQKPGSTTGSVRSTGSEPPRMLSASATVMSPQSRVPQPLTAEFSFASTTTPPPLTPPKFEFTEKTYPGLEEDDFDDFVASPDSVSQNQSHIRPALGASMMGSSEQYRSGHKPSVSNDGFGDFGSFGGPSSKTEHPPVAARLQPSPQTFPDFGMYSSLTASPPRPPPLPSKPNTPKSRPTNGRTVNSSTSIPILNPPSDPKHRSSVAPIGMAPLLPPPPGSKQSQRTHDFFAFDESPSVDKVAPVLAPPPQPFAQSMPAPVLKPPSAISQTSAKLLAPITSSGTRTASLSAQDLSFFEGL